RAKKGARVPRSTCLRFPPGHPSPGSSKCWLKGAPPYAKGQAPRLYPKQTIRRLLDRLFGKRPTDFSPCVPCVRDLILAATLSFRNYFCEKGENGGPSDGRSRGAFLQ